MGCETNIVTDNSKYQSIIRCFFGETTGITTNLKEHTEYVM
jgi:hypothetical protein